VKAYLKSYKRPDDYVYHFAHYMLAQSARLRESTSLPNSYTLSRAQTGHRLIPTLQQAWDTQLAAAMITAHLASPHWGKYASALLSTVGGVFPTLFLLQKSEHGNHTATATRHLVPSFVNRVRSQCIFQHNSFQTLQLSARN
jgi:hypothetical protein